MDEKRVDEVVFVEVKTGESRLNPVERSLRDAIQEKRVSWAEWRGPKAE
jgi:predicted Holliday junction resolvase-like endonuclease